MNELLARSLTVEELAERLCDDPEPAVKRLALAVIEGDYKSELQQRLEDAESEKEGAESSLSEAERLLGEATDLLERCEDSLSGALRDKVSQWLAGR